MQEDINQEITFRKLSVFMMFMAKGNIARTAEAMELSGVSVHRALHTLEEGVGCSLFVHKGRNLLPLPALDGGRLVFLIIEAIFRRPVPAKYERWVHAGGFALLICLVLAVTFQDIMRIATGG